VPFRPIAVSLLLTAIAFLQFYGQARAERSRKTAEDRLNDQGVVIERISVGVEDLAVAAVQQGALLRRIADGVSGIPQARQPVTAAHPPMMPCCFAWGNQEVVSLPDGTVVWRMPFQMLPGATMLNAQCCQHGMVCAQAEVDGGLYAAETRFRINPGTDLEIYCADATLPIDLEPFIDQIIDAFKAHMAEQQKGQAA